MGYLLWPGGQFASWTCPVVSTPFLQSQHQPNMSRFVNMYRVCWSSCRVDYDRIKAVGPDRAAAEWLLRCGAKVRFEGFERYHHDYNGLPTGPLGRYKIQAIDATESCIMHRGFDHLGQCYTVDNIMFLSLWNDPPFILHLKWQCEDTISGIKIYKELTKNLTHEDLYWAK